MNVGRPFTWIGRQQEFFNAGPQPTLYLGGVGAGKLLALDTAIPTVNGWKANGDIVAGDMIFDERGRPARVLAAHEVTMPDSMFRVYFTGGTWIDAGGEHLWTAWDFSARKALRSFDGLFPDDWPNWHPYLNRWKNCLSPSGPRTVTTTEMYESQRAHREHQANWGIPNTLPLILPDADLPLDPYLLGVWLGDGTASSGTYTGMDQLLSESYVVKKDPRTKDVAYRVPGLTADLKRHGLLNNKHVPSVYLRASVSQRLALLQGLMDTDGTCDFNGRSTFTNTNRQLADAVFELMCSLGLNPTLSEGRATLYGRDCGPVWDVYVAPPVGWPMFRMARKQSRLTSGQERRKRFKYVSRIERIEPKPARCLTVDSPNHLYLAGDAMVPTHNTYSGVMKMLYLLDEYPGSHGAVVRQRANQLKRTTAATLWKLLPPNAVAARNDNEGFLKLKNGSELLFVHLDKPDSLNFLKSLELNFAFIDQAEDLTAEAWDTLEERLGRWTGALKRGGYPKSWPHRDQLGTPLPPSYLFASAYSPGYDHWLTARFWEYGIERERYRKRGYQVIVGSTRDNKYLPESYIAGRLAMGSEYIRRFVDAVDWGAREGTIFHLDDQSIVEPTSQLLATIHRLMRLHRVYDHGEYSPAACLWFATDAHGNCFCYREYMKDKLLVSEHRRNIWELSKPDGDPVPRYTSQLADPIIFDKTRGKSVNTVASWSIADEFADRRTIDPQTAITWTAADNNEASTIARLHEFLRVDEHHRNPITGALGAPRLYFLKRTPEYPHGCHEVITDIRSARRLDKGTAPDGSKLYLDERDDRVRDHLLDCVRYFVVSRPSVGRLEAPPPPEPGTIRLKDYEVMCEAQRMSRSRDEYIHKLYGKYGY